MVGWLHLGGLALVLSLVAGCSTRLVPRAEWLTTAAPPTATAAAIAGERGPDSPRPASPTASLAVTATPSPTATPTLTPTGTPPAPTDTPPPAPTDTLPPPTRTIAPVRPTATRPPAPPPATPVPSTSTAEPALTATNTPPTTLPATTAPPTTPLSTPPPTLIAGCAFLPVTHFGLLWRNTQEVRDLAGCPTAPAVDFPAAEQTFDRGYMFWRGDIALIYVLTAEGVWASYPDRWVAGDLEPTSEPPEGHYAPVRGFGRLWRENRTVRDALGWPNTPERALRGAAQPFERGQMLLPDRQIVYVLPEGRRWREYRDEYR